MLRRLLPVLLCLLPAILPVVSVAAEYIGSTGCGECHAKAFDSWKGSHHDLAMQVANADTVLGDFDNATFQYNGITTTFLKRDGQYVVRTDGEDGKLQDFPVDYVFGVYPLQQYLLPLSRGRWQALSIAWDARPQDEGGQRWYHLYPDEAIDYKDPLHWTGPYQNWNTRCAECHSTDLHKNYDAKTRSFDTRYEEINVGCEACHGPGSTHVELAEAGTLGEYPDKGLAVALGQRGDWAFTTGASIASRQSALGSDTQIDNCGRCHSRRSTLGDYHYGADLLDTHRLSMPQSPLYHVDGQILDEVYVYGSFVQSKMHQAGVVCSNCHEPHSATLRAPGNGVCAQCHRADVYDSDKHHHHTGHTAGTACAACHMPEATYMGVDPRRDHSIRIPRPDLSVMLGTPNACNSCHTDRDATWALRALEKWGVKFTDSASHPARSFALALMGDTRALPSLAQLATNPNTAPIWRATAMESLGEFGGREAMQSMSQLLYDDDPMIRASTVRALEFVPLQQRFALLQPMFDEKITAVRMEIAMSLAGVPLDQIPREQATKLGMLFADYLKVQRQHADMPSVQLQMGIFLTRRGDLPAAEAAYREALALNPQLIGALLNLADVLRTQSREDEARELLRQAVAIAPENGDSLHALGLLETRSGNSELALVYLGKAAALEQRGTRHRFVYAIALHDLGQPGKAIATLQELLRTVPQDQQVLLALANYNAELGQREQARIYARHLTELAPGNRDYQALLQGLSGP